MSESDEDRKNVQSPPPGPEEERRRPPPPRDEEADQRPPQVGEQEPEDVGRSITKKRAKKKRPERVRIAFPLTDEEQTESAGTSPSTKPAGEYEYHLGKKVDASPPRSPPRQVVLEESSSSLEEYASVAGRELFSGSRGSRGEDNSVPPHEEPSVETTLGPRGGTSPSAFLFASESEGVATSGNEEAVVEGAPFLFASEEKEVDLDMPDSSSESLRLLCLQR